jgi:hypothetical protein
MLALRGLGATSRVGPARPGERRPTIVSFIIDPGGPAFADPRAGTPDLVPPYNYPRFALKPGRAWNVHFAKNGSAADRLPQGIVRRQ